MTRIGTLFIALLLYPVTPLRAQEPTVLVELFTSQGCSSCPPADALLRELARREDVLALALHVDYWDYIGWKDIFARPENSARQRAYAAADGRRMVYTPQIIIDGSDEVMGTHPKDVAALIEKHSAGGDVSLDIVRADDSLTIEALAAPGAEGICAVQLVRYRRHATVEITRGENAGRTLDYTNIVTDMTRLADWDMRTPLNLQVPLTGDLPAAVVIQHGRNGPVEAMARVH
ncbi:DUF1223 domain-containing protein [Roseovarius amoyensis]|uniref:DUF1223 domain-containing protein n=1 Tax=Roseovarius amoyensis TaxID=2211448 RepID=UPI000DBE9FD2|nr:DUF1223 domain-containing protein [Roseovarius amoyensis]